jgi:hypothetical protein
MPPNPLILAPGELVLRMSGQSRVDDTADRLMTVERFGDHKRVGAMPLHAQRQGFDAAQYEKAVKGPATPPTAFCKNLNRSDSS